MTFLSGEPSFVVPDIERLMSHRRSAGRSCGWCDLFAYFVAPERRCDALPQNNPPPDIWQMECQMFANGPVLEQCYLSKLFSVQQQTEGGPNLLPVEHTASASFTYSNLPGTGKRSS